MMGAMEAHNHILYEETFKRIATVLDVIAESQGKHEERMAEHEQEVAQIRGILKQTAVNLDQTVVNLDALTVRMDSLAGKMDILAVKSAESEDRLNALITLVDQHIQ